VPLPFRIGHGAPPDAGEEEFRMGKEASEGMGFVDRQRADRVLVLLERGKGAPEG
jgi:hypothetical protein